ncbi:alpha/beta fold hydrolase [Chitinophaga rhizosphaerae]|uniref:alpha/beta fold hydrolase n=1 Tax=Chitinophaga rhizosphaerae TaxID=1864947 RepID=UPI000F808045|nr:alpha/beta hydrolase [Chitinophaga rhizosphaerae]
MNKHILARIVLILTVAAVSCQQATKENPAGVSKGPATDQQPLKPSDSGFADVNGIKLYYEVYGEGKPIVLLHGSFMTIPLNWSQMIPMLKGRKVIAAEMQGHGRTKDTDRAFNYENMADDVSGLLKHLKIDSADVLGYSMGGGVAFQLAVRHPEQVRRLIVLSGSYAHDGWWPDVEASFATMNADIFKGSPIEQQYLANGNDPAKFPAYVDKVMSPDLTSYDWSKDVKNIKAPLFFVIGDADGIRYEHAIELFKAKGGGKMGDMYGLPQSRLAILPGTTHIGMMQRTGWLIPMVTDFLDSNLDPTPPTF